MNDKETPLIMTGPKEYPSETTGILRKFRVTWRPRLEDIESGLICDASRLPSRISGRKTLSFLIAAPATLQLQFKGRTARPRQPMSKCKVLKSL